MLQTCLFHWLKILFPGIEVLFLFFAEEGVTTGAGVTTGEAVTTKRTLGAATEAILKQSPNPMATTTLPSQWQPEGF